MYMVQLRSSKVMNAMPFCCSSNRLFLVSFCGRFSPFFTVLGFGLVISLFKVASMDCAKVLLSISEYKKTNALWIK